jgi:hypothetical protein
MNRNMIDTKKKDRPEAVSPRFNMIQFGALITLRAL